MRPLFCLWILAASMPAAAQTAAITFSNASTSAVAPNLTAGWLFTLDNPVTVAGLGFYDAGSDGLAENHPVAIWDSNGAQLLTVTIAAGSANPLIAGFRYTSAMGGTTELAAGQYVIGVYWATSADEAQINSSIVTPMPGLSYQHDRFAFGNLVFPMNSTSMNSIFGPNFLVVPEPSSLLVFALAFALHLRGKGKL